MAILASWHATILGQGSPAHKCLLYQELLHEMDCKVHEHAWPDRWYFGRERRFIHAGTEASQLLH